jgi:extracellular elastinolytic metalloproteinase
MKLKNLLLKTAIVFFAILFFSLNKLSAQELTAQTARELIKTNAAAIGLSKTDIQNLRISSAYIDKISGASLVYAQQTYKGIDVFNSIQNYVFKNNNLVSSAGGRIPKIDEIVNVRTAKATLTPADAVRAAASHLNVSAPVALLPLKQVAELKQFDFGKLDISSVDVKSRLIWLTDEINKTASLAWQVEIQPNGVPDYWLVNVDASKGVVINKYNLNVSCKWSNASQAVFDDNRTATVTADDNAEDNTEGLDAVSSAKYKVIHFPAESPNHPGGVPSVHLNPWTLAGAGNAATTLKWNDNGTTSFDSSRGNNVLAQEDVNGNNGLGTGAHATKPLPNLVFNYTPNFNKKPDSGNNQQFAITNLFYWNNIMHDISYQYGFDEISGNFQANNLGRGGNANDYVLADAQDGSGSNNANFSTPADGSSPRMQMYLFNAVPGLTVIKPASFAGKKAATESAFSKNNKLANTGSVQARIVLYADNAGNTTHEGCDAAFNAAQLNGKIALIDRGTCDFALKAKNAQNAGAKAVIIADNIPGEYPFLMGGTDNTITIPAVMTSFETADTMKQILQTDPTLTIKLATGVKLDGDLDNGVISHEYTHGISNRLTGGPNVVTCLSNKEEMGEGWSDYMALMVTTDWTNTTMADSSKSRPLGTYVFGQFPGGSGIRFYPYSTSFSVNSWTYDSMKLSNKFSNNFLFYDSHVVGEVWCNMLWNMTWALIGQTGTISPNIYNAGGNGGNNIALQLVIEGLKLQVCSPGFVDGRNAILKADSMLYGGTHVATIWQVFASRGLGYNASQGSSANIKDGTADYSLPPAHFAIAKQDEDVVAQKSSIITIAPNPATNKVALTIKGNDRLLTVSLVNASGHELKRFNMNGETLKINLPKLASGMYYLRISGEGFSETRKLIIQ